jgi:hypothetical protein
VPSGEIPTYSNEVLEEEATKLLEGRFGADIPIPVDVEWLTETLEGVDLDCYPALRSNYGVDGGVWREGDGGNLLVAIDEDLMDDDSPPGVARYRMVVAQELAHLIIHREAVSQVEGPDQFRSFHNRLVGTQVERDTRRLAGALLMPQKQLQDEANHVYRQLVQLVGTGNAPAVQKFLCSRLAQRFKVSEKAMQHRLGEGPMPLRDQVEQALRKGLSHLP